MDGRGRGPPLPRGTGNRGGDADPSPQEPPETAPGAVAGGLHERLVLQPRGGSSLRRDLAGKPVGGFDVLTGTKKAASPSDAGDQVTADALASVDLYALRGDDLETRVNAVMPVLSLAVLAEELPLSVVGPQGANANLRCLTSALEVLDIDFTVISEPVELPSEIIAVIGGSCDAPLEVCVGDATELRISPAAVRLEEGHDPVARLLHGGLRQLPVTGRLLNLTSGARADEDEERNPPSVGPAQPLAALAGRLFPDVEPERARGATDTLVELASMARRGEAAPLLVH